MDSHNVDTRPLLAKHTFTPLIALLEQDTGMFAWSGSLTGTCGDTARAEALHLKQERLDEARNSLATHLAKRLDDDQARALQVQIDRRKR